MMSWHDLELPKPGDPDYMTNEEAEAALASVGPCEPFPEHEVQQMVTTILAMDRARTWLERCGTVGDRMTALAVAMAAGAFLGGCASTRLDVTLPNGTHVRWYSAKDVQAKVTDPSGVQYEFTSTASTVNAQTWAGALAAMEAATAMVRAALGAAP